MKKKLTQRSNPMVHPLNHSDNLPPTALTEVEFYIYFIAAKKEKQRKDFIFTLILN